METILIESHNDKREKFAFFHLSNSGRVSVTLSNYGARITSITTPDKNGNLADVVLGYDTPEDYFSSTELYFGATVGRFANRIANGSFELDGKRFQLDKNNGSNALHGGIFGFHNAFWDVVQLNHNQVRFQYYSKDGEEGYPGNLSVHVTYTLTERDELEIDFWAVSDKKTILNLTNHAYFNLSGAGSGSVANHLLTINADAFTPINKSMIPTGEIRPVAGTPFDFRLRREMGSGWNADDEQIRFARGYDHNFVLNKSPAVALEWAARVVDPVSGRMLQVETTEPGLQFYTANFLTGKDVGRECLAYTARTAFCLETQHFPDSPNQPHFPSVVLEAETPFVSKTLYRFSLAKTVEQIGEPRHD